MTGFILRRENVFDPQDHYRRSFVRRASTLQVLALSTCLEDTRQMSSPVLSGTLTLFFFHFPRLMGFFAFCLQEESPFFFFFWRWRFGREARYGISCFARGSGGPFLIFVFLGWWREDIVNGGAKLSSPVVEDWAEVEGARPPHIISFPVWFLVQSSFASCRMKVHIFCLPIVTLGQVEFLFTFLGNYHCTQCKSWCDEYWHQQLDS